MNALTPNHLGALAATSRADTSATGAATATRAEAERVADQFEEILIQQMVQGLRQTTSFDGEEANLFGDSAGSETYDDWFDQHLSTHLLKAGGIGVRDSLLRDWDRLGKVAPPPADGGPDGKAPVGAPARNRPGTPATPEPLPDATELKRDLDRRLQPLPVPGGLDAFA